MNKEEIIICKVKTRKENTRIIQHGMKQQNNGNHIPAERIF